MKKLVALLVLASSGSLAIAAERSASSLPRSSPEAQGIASTDLLAFIDAADRSIDAMNSFMLVRRGHVVAEGWWSPYRAEAPHSLYSLSKSFTSTAVGLAVAEGKLSVDDEVLKFFPGDAPKEPGKNLKAMRVSDLLRMSTGHEAEPARTDAEPWTKTFLHQPVPFKPGTHFLYNTSATYMLSAIVQKATGMTVLDYLRPRLFEPLGIENPTWEASPQGITTGGYGLSIRTEDIARFGQLYLQKGNWHGKQLVPAAWVDKATSFQTSNGSDPKSDWEQGYGYQFWRSRHNAFRGDGAFGQYCIVIPEQDAVIAITSGVRDMQAVLNLIWNKLLPAFKPGPLATDPEAHKALEARLASLTLRPQDGPSTPAHVSHQKFLFAPNTQKLEAISLESDAVGNDVTLVARVDGADHPIPCGRGAWKLSRAGYPPLADQPAAASGGWTADDTYTAKICFYETPFMITLRLKFSSDRLLLEAESNVGFRQTRLPLLVGKPG